MGLEPCQFLSDFLADLNRYESADAHIVALAVSGSEFIRRLVLAMIASSFVSLCRCTRQSISLPISADKANMILADDVPHRRRTT
jgi:hypothetical protein